MKTKLDFTKIRKQLPHGSQTEIAKKASVHINLVHRVLNGKSDNIQVLTAIADYLSDLKEKENNVIDRLTSLVD